MANSGKNAAGGAGGTPRKARGKSAARKGAQPDTRNPTPQLTKDELEALRARLQRKYR